MGKKYHSASGIRIRFGGPHAAAAYGQLLESTLGNLQELDAPAGQHLSGEDLMCLNGSFSHWRSRPGQTAQNCRELVFCGLKPALRSVIYIGADLSCVRTRRYAVTLIGC